jgi:MFS family permease
MRWQALVFACPHAIQARIATGTIMKSNAPAQASWATFTLFLLHGIMVGSWVPHIPLAKERLDVGPGMFGLALLAIAAGAVTAMPLTGAMINRYGSSRVALVTGALFCIAFAGPVTAPTLVPFIIMGYLLGALIGSMDVAMNAHGIAVERQLKRPIMSMLHGGFSVGGMVGAFLGALAMKHMGEFTHIALAGGACLILLFVAAQFLLPRAIDKGLSDTHFGWPTRATIGLGLLCFLALMAEGSVLDWSAIYFTAEFKVDAGTAGLAYAFFSGGMAASRFTGDWLRQKFGAVPMVVASALLTAVSVAFAVSVSSFLTAVVAFTFAGIGIGNIAPVLFAGGGRLEPDAPGRGIAAVTTLGYAGFLAGPPLIGFAAEVTSLGHAFWLIVLSALVIAVFATKARAADTY